jgi:hypothetical protein
MNTENTADIEQTYEKYAEDLNTHADQCEVCTAARKTSTTHGVCEEGRKLVDAWKAFVKAEAEKLFGAETTDVPKD